MTIKHNVGGIDRILRFGIGVVLIYGGFFSDYLGADSISAIVFGSAGLFFLLTAIFRNCPFYGAIGFSTASENNKKREP